MQCSDCYIGGWKSRCRHNHGCFYNSKIMFENFKNVENFEKELSVTFSCRLQKTSTFKSQNIIWCLRMERYGVTLSFSFQTVFSFGIYHNSLAFYFS